MSTFIRIDYHCIWLSATVSDGCLPLYPVLSTTVYLMLSDRLFLPDCCLKGRRTLQTSVTLTNSARGWTRKQPENAGGDSARPSPTQFQHQLAHLPDHFQHALQPRDFLGTFEFQLKFTFQFYKLTAVFIFTGIRWFVC